MKKKAFTLTELLVVVVIIGTLAAVVMPKFTRVLEARKTTEAENIMRAVRTEQEARCTLDKNYTADKAKLASYPKNEGNNYDYELTTTGMSATSKSEDKKYTLQMLSYLDGGICCSGDYCSSLNKDYPACNSYVAKANAGCAAQDLPEPDPLTHEECDTSYTEGQEEYIPCGCGLDKVKTWHCENGAWTSTVNDEACIDIDSEKKKCEAKNGNWDGCNCTEPEACQPPDGREAIEEHACPDGGKGHVVATWDTSICKYKVKEQCDYTCDTDEHTKYDCEHESHGQWDDSICGCVCPDKEVWENGRCAETCENEETRELGCEQPNGPRAVSGRWYHGGNGLSCKCVCPPYSSLSDEGYCEEDPFAGTRAWRECEDLYGPEWCDQWAKDLGGEDLADLLRAEHFYNGDNPDWWDDYSYETGDVDWNWD